MYRDEVCFASTTIHDSAPRSNSGERRGGGEEAMKAGREGMVGMWRGRKESEKGRENESEKGREDESDRIREKREGTRGRKRTFALWRWGSMNVV